MTWLMTGAVAGMEQASNTFAGYGQGAQGYGKRFGANYADGFHRHHDRRSDSALALQAGSALLLQGNGDVHIAERCYAIANAVICKGDNGHWQPNYSGILGGLAAGGISNLYYPAGNRSGVELTFVNALVGTGEGAVQNLFQEFVVRRLTPRLPALRITARSKTRRSSCN